MGEMQFLPLLENEFIDLLAHLAEIGVLKYLSCFP